MAEADSENEKIRESMAALQNDLTALGGQREGLVGRMNAIRRMQEHFDGYNTSIRYVMGQAANGRLAGIHGPLSHLIRVQKE